MKRTSFFLILSLFLITAGVLNAQPGRQVGARRFVLDNSDGITANNVVFVDVSGSLGIDNSGIVSGTYPNTTAMMTLFAGAKTTNLRIDGGSTWGIDVVNTNNSIRTSGSNIFGSLAGNVSTTVNINGTGSLTLNGIAAPALPSPFSNLLYLNASNQVQQTPAGVNIISGSGTANTLPLWTGTGNTLGNSRVTQSAAPGNVTISDNEIVTGNITVNGQGSFIGNSTANQQLTIRGVADAVAGNTLGANPSVWDLVVTGDMVATGLIKAGGSLWIDGTSATHQIVANAPINIGTTNANAVNIITNGAIRQTIDATGNLQANGNISVIGTTKLGTAGTPVRAVYKLTVANIGAFPIGPFFAMTYLGSFGAVGFAPAPGIGDVIIVNADPGVFPNGASWSATFTGADGFTINVVNTTGALLPLGAGNLYITAIKY